MKEFSHRGVTFDKKINENHMLSFLAAKRFGYDGIELDIHFCKGCILVHHDRIFKNIDITQMNRGHAKKYDILTLEQALDICKGTDIIIDIKSNLFEPKKTIEKHILSLKHLLTHFNYQNKVYLCSFNEHYLHYISTMLCYYPIGLITDNLTNFHKYDFISISHDMITKELVEECHNKNIEVYTWVVKYNDYTLLDYLIDCGVDGVIVDE
jgi:glycerophosphoryl diester phosphodiesterase